MQQLNFAPPSGGGLAFTGSQASTQPKPTFTGGAPATSVFGGGGGV